MATDFPPPCTTPPSLSPEALSLQQVFGKVQVDSCPHTYNFHMHTHHSDGRLSPDGLMEQAIAIGLKGLAITDHHRVSAYYVAQTYLEQRRWQDPHQDLPMLWTGTEITSDLNGTEVHILCYAFDPEHRAIAPYLRGKAPKGDPAIASQVIAAAHHAGGVAILAHPARYRRPAQELIPDAVAAGIDGVETYYAYSNPNPWHPSPKETAKVYELARIHNLFSTCGTDTHGLNLLQRL